ncbi:MAG: biotin--[acetyl-CoA-carboxylase] ligase, partial [Methanocorpusculum sp.]|nr:biotin--[acetyl-CoA-carboxylase] ligase [Methanocorpusculum sp.]
MNTADSVLAILERAGGSYVSGEAIAERLSISRTAVWKAIQSLKDAGHGIEAAAHRGYCLPNGADILSAGAIRAYLPADFSGDIILKETTGSTNTDAKALAVAGAAHGTVIFANEQTAGRGRLGRTFYSPAGSGIYLSIILKMQCPFADAVLATSAAAVAVCRTIETFADLRPQIKWVNDILLDGKKVCGIGCEAVSDFESGMIESVIVGVGVNFQTESFPEELRDRAGSVFSESAPVSRNRFAAELINRILQTGSDMKDRGFIAEYKSRSAVLGRMITYTERGVTRSARAVDIDDTGGLVIEGDSGRRTL